MRAIDPVSDVGQDTPPVLEIVAGHPTAEELAAVVVVLAALSHPGVTSEPAAAPSGWTDRTAGARPVLRPGPSAWRLSARHR